MPRILVSAFLTLTFLFPASLAVAQYQDGRELLNGCEHILRPASELRPDQHLELSFCLGLMQGITATNGTYVRLLHHAPPSIFCGPADGIRNGQAARIVRVSPHRERPDRSIVNS